MKSGVVVALLLACSAGAGWGIWNQASLKNNTEDFTVSQTAVQETVTVSGIVDTRLAGAVSSSSQRSGIVKYPVTVERQETKKVTSSSSRKVSEVLVNVGDTVEDGTVLMRYDDENDEMTIQSMEYDIEKMKLDIETRNMSIEKAQAELPKLQGLDYEQRLLQISQTKNAIAMDEYNIEVREKNIEALREMISEKEIKSRYVGIVTKIQKGNGSSNNDEDSDSDSGQYTVVIAESQNLLLKGTCTDADVSNIYQGESIVAYSRANPDIYWYGVINQVKKPGENQKSSDSDEEDNSDSSGSGSYTYYAVLEKEDGLLIGQHLFIEPDLGQTKREEGLWIDTSYLIREEDGQTYVWVENENSRIEKRAVTVSKADDYGKVMVEEGLDSMEYIAENMPTVKEGMRTRHADENSVSSNSAGSGAGIVEGNYDYYEEDYDDMGDFFSDDEDWLMDDLGDFGDYDDGDSDFGDYGDYDDFDDDDDDYYDDDDDYYDDDDDYYDDDGYYDDEDDDDDFDF